MTIRFRRCAPGALSGRTRAAGGSPAPFPSPGGFPGSAADADAPRTEGTSQRSSDIAPDGESQCALPAGRRWVSTMPMERMG
jgi:hypothetical protein